MLVLTRREGEVINIGDNITVEVHEIRGNRVVLAFAAPKGMLILRGELVDGWVNNLEVHEEIKDLPPKVCAKLPENPSSIMSYRRQAKL